jgi:hypothetical protein
MYTIISKAILKINPNAQFAIGENDINQVQWINTTPISKADIEAQFPIVELDMAMETLRAKRNKALVDSDWTILSDVPLNPAMRSAWMNYRTLLRNITDNLTTVEDVKAVTLPIPPK